MIFILIKVSSIEYFTRLFRKVSFLAILEIKIKIFKCFQINSVSMVNF